MSNRAVLSFVTLVAILIAAISPTSAATRLQQKDVDPSDHQVSQALDIAIEPPSDLWTSYETASAKSALGESDFTVVDGKFAVFALDLGRMDAVLANVPAEFSTLDKRENYQVSLPMPNGTLQRFRVWDSPIMEPALAAEYPDVKTYVGQGVDDPTATVRFDRTPLGFHAMIISASQTVFVDPYVRGDYANYISYDKRGLRRETARMACLVDAAVAALDQDGGLVRGGDESRVSAYTNGGTLRTYRLAQACTGEYATTVCTNNGVAVTVANTMTAITTTINRVTGIYERELSTRLVLVANNSSIVFINGTTDPYTNNNPNSLLSQNQTRCNSAIGSANYDIGHVFSTGGGGLAGLGVVCTSSKAQGETGNGDPRGDGFDVDYVAHEMGHQFGGNHTFISNLTGTSCEGNGNPSTAYERGSGVTIQAYAGICGSDDLEAHSYDYFHSISLNEMSAYMAAGGNCSSNTATGNTVPSLTIGASYTGVPAGTPFTLTAQSASDANGDSLTYVWEDWATGTSCKFRPWPVSSSSSRTFPRMQDVLAGSNSTNWETTSGLTGSKTFRCTVRDNRAGGGAYTSATMTVAFVAGTAFSVSAPNTAVSWAGNSSQTVTWVKGASTSANVAIDLSTNGGSSWTTVVASTANDGSEAITVPNTPSTTCRIRVRSTTNVYFDVSNANFTITAGGSCSYSISPSSATAPAGGTTGTVGVTAGAGCAWTATSNAAWLTITSGASGSGNGSTGYTVTANAGAARSGTLTVAGSTFTVNQDAAASCSYSISPTSASPGTAATTGSVSVTAGAGCAWAATSNAAWLTITSGASGTGNGSTGYSVAENTGAARTGTLTIAGSTFTVNQAGVTAGATPIACGASATGALATTDVRSSVKGATFYADNYSFTPTASGTATITLNASPLDAYLVLKSSLGATSSLAVDDDGNGGTNSKITYTVTAGTTYYIEATSYSANATGSYTLALACGTPPVELVTNGGFDTGSFTPWVAVANSSVVTSAVTAPQAGPNAAKMLGVGSTATTNFYQSIAGFNGATKTLRFYLKMTSAEGTGTAYDFLYVRLKNTAGTTVSTLGTYDNRQKSTYAGWVQVTLTVPATALTNYRISFDGTEDSSLQTTFFIDGVSIQ